MTFRDAYNKVAELVILNEKLDKQVSLNDFDVFSSVESRSVNGGTSKKQIQNTIAWICERVKQKLC